MITVLVSPLLFLSSSAPEAPGWRERIRLIPALILFSIGMSVNNAEAALRGLFVKDGGVFYRTPKMGVGQSNDTWEFANNSFLISIWEIPEVIMLIIALIGIGQAVQSGNYFVAPWLVLYAYGFGMIAYLSLKDRKTKITINRISFDLIDDKNCE
jgi:hypothetical protein